MNPDQLDRERTSTRRRTPTSEQALLCGLVIAPLGVLAVLDWLYVPVCLGLLIPATLLQTVCIRRSKSLIASRCSPSSLDNSLRRTRRVIFGMMLPFAIAVLAACLVLSLTSGRSSQPLESLVVVLSVLTAVAGAAAIPLRELRLVDDVRPEQSHTVAGS